MARRQDQEPADTEVHTVIFTHSHDPGVHHPHSHAGGDDADEHGRLVHVAG